MVLDVKCAGVTTCQRLECNPTPADFSIRVFCRRMVCCKSLKRAPTVVRRESDYWGRMVRGSGNVAVRSAVEPRSSRGWAEAILFDAIARHTRLFHCSRQGKQRQRAENRVATWWADGATAGLLHAYFSTWAAQQAGLAGVELESRTGQAKRIDGQAMRATHPAGVGAAPRPPSWCLHVTPPVVHFPPAGPSHM